MTVRFQTALADQRIQVIGQKPRLRLIGLRPVIVPFFHAGTPLFLKIPAEFELVVNRPGKSPVCVYFFLILFSFLFLLSHWEPLLGNISHFQVFGAVFSDKILSLNDWNFFKNCMHFTFAVWKTATGQSFANLLLPTLGELQLRIAGARYKNLKMSYPSADRVYKQKGSGSGASLAVVRSSSLVTPIG